MIVQLLVVVSYFVWIGVILERRDWSWFPFFVLLTAINMAGLIDAAGSEPQP